MNCIINQRLLLVATFFMLGNAMAAAPQNLTFKYMNPAPSQLVQTVIQLTPSLSFNVGRYVQQTNMKRRAEFRQAFTPSFRLAHLTKPAEYQETVEGLGDRLKVVRTLKLEFKDPCDPDIPKALSFCFKRTNKPINLETKAELDEIRKKIRVGLGRLKNRKEREKYMHVAKMNDADLLGFLLNKSTPEKTITHTSEVPFRLSAVRQKTGVKRYTDQQKRSRQYYWSKSAGKEVAQATVLQPMPTSPLEPIERERIEVTKPEATNWFDNTHSYEFGVLFGDDVGRDYGDTVKYQFFDGLSFMGTKILYPMYLKLSYKLNFGMGLRLPFDLKVNTAVEQVYQHDSNTLANYPARSLCAEAGNAGEAHLCSASGVVEIRAQGTPIQQSDAAYYREEMGVPSDKLFDGKEFVFQLHASCRLYVSIIGPDIDIRCPTIDMDQSQDFQPQIGDTERKILEFRIPEQLARTNKLGVDIGVAYAVLQPGVALKADDGRIVFDLETNRSTLIPPTRRIEVWDVPAKLYAKEAVDHGQAKWGIKLSNADYHFNASLVPDILIVAGIDLGIVSWGGSLGPYELDALEFGIGELDFDRYPGTSDQQMVTIGTRRERD